MAETRPSKETFVEWHTTKDISHMSVKRYVQYCKCASTFRVGDEFLVHHGDASRPYSATIVGSFRKSLEEVIEAARRHLNRLGYPSDSLLMFGVREPHGMFYPSTNRRDAFDEVVPDFDAFRHIWNVYRYRPTDQLTIIKRIRKAPPI